MELEVGGKIEQKWPSWGRSERAESNPELLSLAFWDTWTGHPPGVSSSVRTNLGAF